MAAGNTYTSENTMAIVVSVITTSTRIVDPHPTRDSSSSSGSRGILPKFAGEIVVSAKLSPLEDGLAVVTSPLGVGVGRMGGVSG